MFWANDAAVMKPDMHPEKVKVGSLGVSLFRFVTQSHIASSDAAAF